MEDITITQSGIENIQVLQNIGRETFYETFAESNTAENMRDYLEKNFDTQKLKSEVMNSDSFFFIAWDGATPIAYLKLNTGMSQTEPQEAGALEIERIYVLQQYHGRNVGQLLYNKALEVAGELNKSFIWLGVWEKNFRALRFYEKNGFTAFDKHIFRMGDDEQTDIMMKKELR